MACLAAQKIAKKTNPDRFLRVKLIGLKARISTYVWIFAVGLSFLLGPFSIFPIAEHREWTASRWTLRRKRPVAAAPLNPQ
jgi:hypothetical protein